MSKQFNIEDLGFVPFPECDRYALIGWLPRLNVRVEYGDERISRETRDTLATGLGWDRQYSAIGEKATKDEIAEILEARQKVYDSLKAALSETKFDSVPVPIGGKNVSIDGREYLLAKIACFEHLYMDAKGKLVKPICIGTTGNRRGAQLLDAATVQLVVARRETKDDKLQPKDAGGAVTDHISVIMPDYAGNRFPDVATRKLYQLRENETKLAGFKPMTDAERLQAVLDLVENHGKGQTDIRNAGYGATLGLRLYFACVIDIFCRQKANATKGEERQAWLSIRLLERFLQPEYKTDDDKKNGRTNPDWLNFAKFQQAAFQGNDKLVAMGNACETQAKLDKENQRRKAQKPPQPELTRPTAQGVKDWIAAVLSGESNRANPMMERKVIQAFAERHDNPFVMDAFKATDQADVKFLTRAEERAVVAQFAHVAEKEVYEQLAIACSGLRDLSDETQVTLLTSFVEKVHEAVAVANEAKKGEAQGETASDASATAETAAK